MENLELCVVKTKRIGEMHQTAGFQRKLLQILVWGYERDEENG